MDVELVVGAALVVVLVWWDMLFDERAVIFLCVVDLMSTMWCDWMNAAIMFGQFKIVF